jgi:hypothetical protein
MTVTRTLRYLAAAGVAAVAAAGVVGAASVAGAAGPGRPVAYTGGCPTVKHTDLAGVTYTAGGKAALDVDGLVFTTTVVADAVQWKSTLGEPVDMDKVNAMSYRTRKLPFSDTEDTGNAAALPAYRVFLTGTEINDSATLVYEPYYQPGVGNPPMATTQTWNVLAGKFWSSKTIGGITAEPGGSYAGNKTWAEIVAANPSAKVVAFAVGQGTYNVKTKARVNNVVFSSKKKCVEHTWTTPPAPTGTGTGTGSPTATATATATGTATVAPPPPGGGSNGGLPVTGVNVGVAVAVGLGLLGVGAVVVFVSRRRRVRFAS